MVRLTRLALSAATAAGLGAALAARRARFPRGGRPPVAAPPPVLPSTLADVPPSPSWTDGPSENPVAALDAARERLRRRADALRAEIGQPAEADPREP